MRVPLATRREPESVQNKPPSVLYATINNCQHIMNAWLGLG